MRKTVLLAAAAWAAIGCVPPASPSQLLADSAYDMNVATRFGRMDVALDYVSESSREDFTRRHRAWGKDLRVVDVEVTKLDMRGNDQADVALNVIWLRQDEAQTRTTQLAQSWQDGRGGWRMTSEKQSGGDAGLIDEPSKTPETAAKSGGDAEAPRAVKRTSFQTKIIRATE